MTLARYNLRATDASGNVIAGASVEVRLEVPGAPLAALKSDRDGTVAESNPLTTDANGRAAFYVVGGFYKITVTSGAFSDEMRYVGIGLAQGSDDISTGLTEREVTASGTVTVTNTDADIILINKTVGAATAVNLPDPATATRKVRIVDRKYDAATNNITITSLGTSKLIMGAASYIIDSNGGSIELKPLADGSGWV
jgi:hypothetical protein